MILTVWPTDWYCYRSISRLPSSVLLTQRYFTSTAKTRFVVWSFFHNSTEQKVEETTELRTETEHDLWDCCKPFIEKFLNSSVIIPCSARQLTFSLASLLFLSFINSIHRLLIFFCTPSSHSLLEINSKSISITVSYQSFFRLSKEHPPTTHTSDDLCLSWTAMLGSPALSLDKHAVSQDVFYTSTGKFPLHQGTQ